MGFPRIRGDVPLKPYEARGLCKFSPHTRGCSCEYGFAQFVSEVFPAYAGMFRISQRRVCQCLSFPRIRGDVPHPLVLARRSIMFSPHTRGCSLTDKHLGGGNIVFPAYAGMFLLLAGFHQLGQGFPRIRGDVPLSSALHRLNLTFSPHTRGCSSMP